MSVKDLDELADRTFGGVGSDKAIVDALMGNGNGVGAYWDGEMNPEGDVGKIVAKHLARGKLNVGNLVKDLRDHHKSLETAYAGTLAAIQAEMDSKPNNAITLMGSNTALGATYPGGTPVVLHARVGGALAATPGLDFKKWMRIHRIFANQVDAANGWMFAGGSVAVTDDPVPSMPNDCALTVFLPEVPRLDSPMARLYSRNPKQNTTLTMSLIHYGTVAIPIVQGITVELHDQKCNMAEFEGLSPSIAHGRSMSSLVNAFADRVRRR
jgi:hypothetical protein